MEQPPSGAAGRPQRVGARAAVAAVACLLNGSRDFVYDDPKTLGAKAKSQAAEPSSSTEPAKYECRTCGQRFQSAQQLGGHQNLHRNEQSLRQRADQASLPVFLSHTALGSGDRLFKNVVLRHIGPDTTGCFILFFPPAWNVSEAPGGLRFTDHSRRSLLCGRVWWSFIVSQSSTTGPQTPCLRPQTSCDDETAATHPDSTGGSVDHRLRHGNIVRRQEKRGNSGGHQRTRPTNNQLL